jgi:hypothetical protein
MVKIFHTIDGSGNCGTALFGGGANGRAPGWKPDSYGRASPPPFIVTKKTKKKLSNKHRTPYKYHAIY